MIPTLVVAGLVVGRWWLVPVAFLVWPALLIVSGVGAGWVFGAGAGALAAANVAVAVAVRRAATLLLRGSGGVARHPNG